ncbi:MAG: hypothetical protein ACO3GP_07465, partial [Candidatus Limnocylindrus sp.]
MRMIDLRNPPPTLALEAPGRIPLSFPSSDYHAELSARWPGYDLVIDFPGYRVLDADGRHVADLVDGYEIPRVEPRMDDTRTRTVEG